MNDKLVTTMIKKLLNHADYKKTINFTSKR